MPQPSTTGVLLEGLKLFLGVLITRFERRRTGSQGASAHAEEGHQRQQQDNEWKAYGMHSSRGRVEGKGDDVCAATTLPCRRRARLLHEARDGKRRCPVSMTEAWSASHSLQSRPGIRDSLPSGRRRCRRLSWAWCGLDSSPPEEHRRCEDKAGGRSRQGSPSAPFTPVPTPRATNERGRGSHRAPPFSHPARRTGPSRIRSDRYAVLRRVPRREGSHRRTAGRPWANASASRDPRTSSARRPS